MITVGGAYREILRPGTHFLYYHIRREVKATEVNVRINNLNVSTEREFSISKPVPVEINLDMSVEYQVKDPRRVAMEMSTPIASLYDRVLQAIRGAVVFATIDEIRTRGEGIANMAFQRLQAMKNYQM